MSDNSRRTFFQKLGLALLTLPLALKSKVFAGEEVKEDEWPLGEPIGFVLRKMEVKSGNLLTFCEGNIEGISEAIEKAKGVLCGYEFIFEGYRDMTDHHKIHSNSPFRAFNEAQQNWLINTPERPLIGIKIRVLEGPLVEDKRIKRVYLIDHRFMRVYRVGVFGFCNMPLEENKEYIPGYWYAPGYSLTK